MSDLCDAIQRIEDGAEACANYICAHVIRDGADAVRIHPVEDELSGGCFRIEYRVDEVWYEMVPVPGLCRRAILCFLLGFDVKCKPLEPVAGETKLTGSPAKWRVAADHLDAMVTIERVDAL